MENINRDFYKKQLKDPSSVLREDAIEILHHAGIRDEEIDSALDCIVKTDTERKVRLAALRYISELGDPIFWDILTTLSFDFDPIIRNRAIIGLNRIGE